MALRRTESALDVLERENEAIWTIFTELDHHRGPGVEDRAIYGDLAKQLIRRLATREAALSEVGHVVAERADRDDLAKVAAALRSECAARRRAMDRLEEMSRGVQGISLNTGQDFDAELVALEWILLPELRWQTMCALPAIRRAIPDDERVRLFHRGRYVRRHAPTNLDPDRTRWWEHVGPVSRLVTVYDHLRDFPRAQRGHRGLPSPAGSRRTGPAVGPSGPS